MSSISEKNVARFREIFSGYSLAHGRYDVKQASDNGKMQGRATTVKSPITDAIVTTHLEGSGAGLGSIMLKDNNTCSFGAIDIDINSIDHMKLVELITDKELPLVVCRSKSGGAHLYLFCKPAIPAKIVQEKLTEWSAALGYGGSEIFPKQTARDGAQDIGNWINLPYFSAGQTLRPAYTKDGPVSLDVFLDIAEKSQIDEETLLSVSVSEKSNLFSDGPPCLQHLAANGGFPNGFRNDGMFSVCLYLLKARPDDFDTALQEYNLEMCSPPLTLAELTILGKSLKKKNYGYKCTQQPLKQFCQKRKCLKAPFGVGGADPATEGLEIGGLTKYEARPGDPVMWGLEINGIRILVNTDTLFDANSFNKTCMARIHRVPIHMPVGRWRKYLDDLVKTADTISVPEDAGPSGQILVWIEQFLSQRAFASSKDEIFTGRPYRESGRVYFRSIDLFSYLDVRRVQYKSQHEIWHLLGEIGVTKVFWNIGGKGVNLWNLPEPEHATAPENVDVQFEMSAEKESF